ncbi:MAG: hypothetical protein IPN45_05890 [Actinomycetales bacterium]|nr:hypothetical protein [Actinomycetales bacterium]MBP8882334.1 hypothetical protein [Dermatophilaceae bacterium]
MTPRVAGAIAERGAPGAFSVPGMPDGLGVSGERDASGMPGGHGALVNVMTTTMRSVQTHRQWRL